MSESTKESRSRKWPPSLIHSDKIRRAASVALALLALAAALDGFLVEPFSIQVSHHRVRAPLAAPLKIAHLSDLHTRGIGRRERRLLALLAQEKPDLIVVTGDTLTRRGTYEMCREMLSRLHAPLGVWVVRGNWENAYPVADERAFYASAGVNFLLNQARPARQDVWIVGLDDASSGYPSLSAALRDVPKGTYSVALFHSPAYFARIAGRTPLALAGHTHGGQVRLPLVPTFWLPRGSGPYLAGWYERRGSRMYVSRGIGMSFLPVRFLCRPELAIITLER